MQIFHVGVATVATVEKNVWTVGHVGENMAIISRAETSGSHGNA